MAQSGEAWREIRKFTVTQLKEFGFGTRSLEPMIEEEAEELFQMLRSQVNRPFKTEMFFNLPAFNVLWQLISRQRFQFNDPTAQKLIHGFER